MYSQTCTSNGAGLERVRYFARQLITADDMLAEQQYFRQKLRRHNRFLHGWGVVCGLEVLSAASDKYPWQVIVGAGYALGPYGDEIYVAEPRCHDLAECIVSIANPCDPKAKPTPVLPPKLYLAIRYSECETRPMRVHPLGCACDETLCEYSRIRDDFELTCLLDPPPKPPVLVCEICDVLMPACPPCPDNPWIVLAEITLPTATKTQTDVMKIPLADADINMLLRRQIFSTTVLQEQLLACCCQQPPASVAADLAVVKDGTVTDQTTLEYSINVTNNGPDHAESVVVTDSLPLGLKYDGIKSSQEWVATNQNMVLTATFAKMAVNETHTLKLIATGPLPDTNDSKDYLNTVEVKSSTSDSDLSNNKSSKTLTIFGPNLA